MKISKISQQTINRERYSIFVDDKYSFSLSEASLLEQKLFTGQTLDINHLKELKKISADDKAYLSTLRYAALRSRSKWEVQSYLKRKRVDETLVNKILNKLSNIGLLDDETYSQAWIDSRRLLKPSSQRRLVQELRQKHVSEDIIKKVLAGSPTDEQTTIKQLILKKQRQSKYRNDKLKLIQYLARQGFNYADIKAALSTEIEDT
jgi:regulatory protein